VADGDIFLVGWVVADELDDEQWEAIEIWGITVGRGGEQNW
jgi:hypothetical protein